MYYYPFFLPRSRGRHEVAWCTSAPMKIEYRNPIEYNEFLMLMTHMILKMISNAEDQLELFKLPVS